jgi:hypothetical protein
MRLLDLVVWICWRGGSCRCVLMMEGHLRPWAQGYSQTQTSGECRVLKPGPYLNNSLLFLLFAMWDLWVICWFHFWLCLCRLHLWSNLLWGNFTFDWGCSTCDMWLPPWFHLRRESTVVELHLWFCQFHFGCNSTAKIHFWFS